MKKLNILITLLVSSFFFFTSGVKADTYDLTLNTSDYSYINDTFTIVRNKAIEYAKENNYYYIISYSNYKYQIYFTSSSNLKFYFKNTYITFDPIYSPVYFTYSSSFTTSTSGMYYSKNISYSNNTISLLFVLDTNIPNVIFNDSSNTINLLYNSCSYTINNGDSFKTLYEYYVSNSNSCKFVDVNNPHASEIEVLSNFYSLSIEKIVLLSNIIVSNYVYLSLIAIFILIFVIYLLRRYFL